VNIDVDNFDYLDRIEDYSNNEIYEKTNKILKREKK